MREEFRWCSQYKSGNLEYKSEGDTVWLQSNDETVKTGWIFTDGIQFGTSKIRPSFEIEIGSEKGKMFPEDTSMKIVFAGDSLFDRLDATIFDTVKNIPGIYFLEGDGVFHVPNTGSGVFNWPEEKPDEKNPGERSENTERCQVRRKIERIGDLPIDLSGTVI